MPTQQLSTALAAETPETKAQSSRGQITGERETSNQEEANRNTWHLKVRTQEDGRRVGDSPSGVPSGTTSSLCTRCCCCCKRWQKRNCVKLSWVFFSVVTAADVSFVVEGCVRQLIPDKLHIRKSKTVYCICVFAWTPFVMIGCLFAIMSVYVVGNLIHTFKNPFLNVDNATGMWICTRESLLINAYTAENVDALLKGFWQ